MPTAASPARPERRAPSAAPGAPARGAEPAAPEAAQRLAWSGAYGVPRQGHGRSAGDAPRDAPPAPRRAEEEPTSVVQRQALPGPDDTASPGPYGVLVDDGAPAEDGRMTVSAFMDALEARLRAVCDGALAMAGRSTEGCPFLETWLSFYRNRSAAHVERAIHRYAGPGGGDAAALIDAVAARARMAAAQWALTGSVPTLPEGVGADGMPAGGAVQAKEDGTAPVSAANPAAVQARLGPGQPLDAGVRSRMERGFGVPFAGVRVHADPPAARLATDLRARAFTVGGDVAFGAGQYRPGTAAGDLLIAHELAHTVQQSGGGLSPAAAESGALEAEADRAAVGALTGTASLLAGLRARLGLRLQRCSDPAPLGPQPTLSQAAASGTTLPQRSLSRMDVNTLVTKTVPERRTWYSERLGPFEAQVRESATAQRIPVQLLALVILNELADINFADQAQSDLFVTKGSLGIAQIQIDTVIRDNLFPDITPEEGRRAYDAFVATQRGWSRRMAARAMRSEDNERRLAINARLQVPQHSINAAAREIRLLLDRMIANHGSQWQQQHGFTHAGLAAGADPQTIYSGIAGATQREREQNLAEMTTAAYNSPGIITAADTSEQAMPNAVIHGGNSRFIAGDLFDMGLFRP